MSDDEWIRFATSVMDENNDSDLEEHDNDDNNESEWRFLTFNHNTDVQFVTEPIEKKFITTFKDEIRVISNRILARINQENDLMNEIVNLFVSSVLQAWSEAANVGNGVDELPVTANDIALFIRTLSFMSYYRKTPTTFFGNREAHPISLECSETIFRKVLNGFSKARSDEMELKWCRPFKNCANISHCERLCNEVNAELAYVEDVSILSQDDDQYRLRSQRCEDIGLVRVNNPKKCFGPVATGCVSLTSGITLAIHIANRGETPLMTSQILLMNLTNCQLPDQVRGRNIVAMDRGYWSAEVIQYMTACGFQLIGTHKRVGSYPFTFGDKTPQAGQRYILERGCKNVYYAKRKVNNVDTYALAYQDGKGNVATLFSTIRDLPLYSFEYIEKVSTTHGFIDPSITEEMHRRVAKVTHGQGGIEWHVIRSTCGGITSTVAANFMRWCQNDMPERTIPLLDQLGIQRNSAPTECEHSVEALRPKTVSDLKNILRSMGLSSSGNKEELVQRILVSSTNEIDVKQQLMKKWFMKPLKNDSNFKIGHLNEPKIAEKLSRFMQENVVDGVSFYDISRPIDCGLVRSKLCDVLYTSADRLCWLIRKPIGGIGPLPPPQVVPIEIKTVTTNSTEDMAFERIRSNLPENRVLHLQFGTSDFRKFVWTTSYRSQVLHHATVYEAEFLLFIVGSVSEIIYVAIINFPIEVRMNYIDFAEAMEHLHLEWYRNPPQEYPSNLDLGHAVDKHTVTLWKSLGRCVQSFLRHQESIQPAHDIRPYLVSLWNNVKGGQDVVSGQLKRVKVDFRSLSPRAFIFIRQIVTQLLNAHLVLRLVRLHLAGMDSFTSYSRLKARLNEMETFSAFLWNVGKRWVPEFKISDSAGDDSLNGEGECEIPKRNRLQFFNEPKGKRLRLSCHGHTLLQAVYPKQRCLLCRMQTSCKCLKCGIHLCRFAFGTNRTSCWQKHHTRLRIEPVERN